MNRRAFVTMLVAAGCTPPPPDWACEEEVFDLAASLPLEASLVGELFVDAYPQFRDRDDLVSELGAIEDIPGRVREDHAAERVLDIEGWLLSVTECRLAALVYLTGQC